MDKNYEDKLNALRLALNETDGKLLAAFDERMELSGEVAKLKAEAGKPVMDPVREAELLRRLSAASAHTEAARELYQTVLRLSRNSQRKPKELQGDSFALPGEKSLYGAKYGLLGASVGYSQSPELHKALGCGDYALWSVPEEELSAFFAENGFAGCNVTIPYKKTVIPYCAQLSPLARDCGAVNTLRREKDGSLTGFNTDAAGFLFSLKKLGFEPAGKKALILGSGGAAAMARTVLTKMGAETVTVSRRGPVRYENLKEHGDAKLLVNCTPVGMQPFEGECLVDLRELPQLSAVLDLVYRPLRTKLLMEAEQRKIPCLNGLQMLAAQAMAAHELWENGGDAEPEPDAAGAEKLAAMLEKRQRNVVLIGMPGCGKSTQARMLGGRLKRPVFDVDVALHYFLGMSPGEYIRRYGETAFREEESAVVRELGRKSGAVIATGGGAVLRPENREALRQNGFVIFLNRRTEELSTRDRPLSADKNRLKALYAERLPIYRAMADRELYVDKNRHETMEDICRILEE